MHQRGAEVLGALAALKHIERVMGELDTTAAQIAERPAAGARQPLQNAERV